MIISGLINDLTKICESYLSDDEQIYYNNEWNKFETNYAFDVAIKYGWLDLLTWCSETKSEKDNYFNNHNVVCNIAAENGHLSILKWLISNGCEVSTQTPAFAAESGHLEIIKWLRGTDNKNENEYKYEWDIWTCSGAAYGNHIDVLKWAYENGCPWDVWTCAFLASNGNLEALKWAIDNGCPWDDNLCRFAAQKNQIEILEWIKEKGCKCNNKYYNHNHNHKNE